MADDGILHTTELLKTALPYVNVKSRLSLEMLLKLYELIICIRNYNTNDIAACGFEEEKVDMEALLNNIRPKCDDNERSFVDKMLNIFQAKRMFEMYNTYMEAMKTMQGFEGFGGDDPNNDDSGGFMNNFKDFDFSSMFGDNFNAESFSDSFKNMSNNKDNNNNDTAEYEVGTYTEEDDPNDTTSYNEIPDDHVKNESNNDNNDMFENLKAMIPPEQMGTFENLRMLFTSMSYDDNNKFDENEE